MPTRSDALRDTLDTLSLDSNTKEDRHYLVTVLRRLGYTETEIRAHLGEDEVAEVEDLGALADEGRLIEVEYLGGKEVQEYEPVYRQAGAQEAAFQLAGDETSKDGSAESYEGGFGYDADPEHLVEFIDRDPTVEFIDRGDLHQATSTWENEQVHAQEPVSDQPDTSDQDWPDADDPDAWHQQEQAEELAAWEQGASDEAMPDQPPEWKAADEDEAAQPEDTWQQAWTEAPEDAASDSQGSGADSWQQEGWEEAPGDANPEGVGSEASDDQAWQLDETSEEMGDTAWPQEESSETADAAWQSEEASQESDDSAWHSEESPEAGDVSEGTGTPEDDTLQADEEALQTSFHFDAPQDPPEDATQQWEVTDGAQAPAAATSGRQRVRVKVVKAADREEALQKARDMGLQPVQAVPVQVQSHRATGESAPATAPPAWPEPDHQATWAEEAAEPTGAAQPESNEPGGEPFVYEGYTLHTREVELSPGRAQRIYFFAKSEPKSGEPCPLPEGYRVKKNQRTGLPYLTRDG